MAKASPSAASNSSEYTVLNSYETPEPSRFPFGMPEGVPHGLASGGGLSAIPKSGVPPRVPESSQSDPEDWLREAQGFNPSIPAPKHPSLRGAGLPVPVDPEGEMRRMEARLRDQHGAELRRLKENADREFTRRLKLMEEENEQRVNSRSAFSLSRRSSASC